MEKMKLALIRYSGAMGTAVNCVRNPFCPDLGIIMFGKLETDLVQTNFINFKVGSFSGEFFMIEWRNQPRKY